MPRNRPTARLSMDRASYAKHKQAIKDLERAVKKAVLERALMAGGKPIHAAAEARAPGPLEIVVVSGRTLRTRVDRTFARYVKANSKLVAIGPSAKHWYYRFFEFGATAHDIRISRTRALTFQGRAGRAFARSAKRTGGTPKRPFMRPAVDANRKRSVQLMADVLDQEIKKAAKK